MMYAGDETTSANDAGPCPACGQPDCWLGCPDAEIDTDVDDLLCGCDYCNLVGQPCWKARAEHRTATKTASPDDDTTEAEAALLELLGRPTQTGTDQ